MKPLLGKRGEWEGSVTRITLMVELKRGGPHYIPYEKLSPEMRKEWDVYESLLMKLSSGKYLYMSGLFFELGSIPSEVEKYVVQEGRDYFKGRVKIAGHAMAKIAAKEHLHAIFVGNPLDHYGFLISRRELNPEEALRIAELHCSTEMDQGMVESCPDAYCGIEESWDRDYFTLECFRDDQEEIIDVIRKFLRESGMEILGKSLKWKSSGPVSQIAESDASPQRAGPSEIEDEGAALGTAGPSYDFSIRCRKVAPPKCTHAGIEGKGTLEIRADSILADIKVPRYLFAALCSVPAIVVFILIRAELGVGWFPVIGIYILCYGFFLAVTRKRKTFEIDPRSGKVYYIKERKIACIELPDGRWLAVKSRRNDDEKLLGELRSLYGEIEYGPGGFRTS